MQFFKPNKWTDDRVLSKAEIPTDPNLPQLSTVPDARTMGCILQDSLPGRFAEGRLRIERCRLVFVRYKPTHYCRVFYTLDISKVLPFFKHFFTRVQIKRKPKIFKNSNMLSKLKFKSQNERKGLNPFIY